MGWRPGNEFVWGGGLGMNKMKQSRYFLEMIEGTTKVRGLIIILEYYGGSTRNPVIKTFKNSVQAIKDNFRQSKFLIPFLNILQVEA